MGTFPNTAPRRKPTPAGMTRTDMAKVISDNCSASTAQARFLVNTLIDAMIRCLESGNRIEIRGFGTLKVSPRKGDKYENKVKFLTSKDLLEIINAK